MFQQKDLLKLQAFRVKMAEKCAEQTILSSQLKKFGKIFVHAGTCVVSVKIYDVK